MATSAPPPRLQALGDRTRDCLTQAMKRIGEGAGFDHTKCTIIMSGGLDSAITAYLAYHLLGVRHAITCLVTPSEATDGPWAEAVAASLPGLTHVILRPTLEELLEEQLPFTVQTLKSFDPMALRNSICACAALQHAAKHGYKHALTGDGADEVLSGYSFVMRKEGEEWVTARQKMVEVMDFDSNHLGAALGMSVASPYLDPDFITYVLTLSREECVGPVCLRPHPTADPDPTPVTAGKIPLRYGFSTVSPSAWRVKDPMEVGSGTTALGNAPWANPPREGHFDSRIPDTDFSSATSDIQATYGITLRDKEHLAYFKIFSSLFRSSSSSNGLLDVPGKPRPNPDPCPACGFKLGTPQATFCTTCGHYDPQLQYRKP